jgi:hypothetical protein
MRAGIRNPDKFMTPLWANHKARMFEIRCDVKWLRDIGIAGVVIGRKILLAQPAHEVDSVVFRHELEHAYQQIRLGRLRFYLLYFFYSLRYGYWNNPLEILAREAGQRMHPHEEGLLWKLREH